MRVEFLFLQNVKNISDLDHFPPYQNGPKHKGTKVIDILLEPKDLTIVRPLILDMIYIIYDISLIKNNYLYYSKIYVIFSLIQKCTRNKFCNCQKFKFIII
jgi:hypothetical protein